MWVPSPTSSVAADPTAAWTLRPARPADAEAWHAVQRTIYDEGRAFVGDGPPSAGALAARLRGLRNVDGAVSLAVALGSGGGGPIGWVEAYRMGAQRLAHVAVLTIAVAPGWRRRGVGGALMAAIADWARRVEVRKLQLHVRADNADAIALYHRLGYGVEGVLREQVAGPEGFEDEWVMALAPGVVAKAPGAS